MVDGVDGDAPGMMLATALAQRHRTACLVSGSRGGDEARNAWLHHACLRAGWCLLTTMRWPVYEHLAVVALH